MKKNLSGIVTTVLDNPQNKAVVIETAPAVAADGKKPAIPAKRLQITTSEHAHLDGLESGKLVKITIEQ